MGCGASVSEAHRGAQSFAHIHANYTIPPLSADRGAMYVTSMMSQENSHHVRRATAAPCSVRYTAPNHAHRRAERAAFLRSSTCFSSRGFSSASILARSARSWAVRALASCAEISLVEHDAERQTEAHLASGVDDVEDSGVNGGGAREHDVGNLGGQVQHRAAAVQGIEGAGGLIGGQAGLLGHLAKLGEGEALHGLSGDRAAQLVHTAGAIDLKYDALALGAVPALARGQSHARLRRASDEAGAGLGHDAAHRWR